MTFVALFIGVVYLIIIAKLIVGFDKVTDFHLQDNGPKTQFSMVIPFRNEAQNLPKLLKSLGNLNYPESLFEIIFVNDESTDDSVSIIETYFSGKQVNFKVIPNHRSSNSPKKDAISTAIDSAKNEWIVTTDADCIVPKYWLDCFDSFIQTNNTNFIVGPVSYHHVTSFLDRFQLLDILSLQGATIGGFGIGKPFLCNGANLVYKKALFHTLNGFEGNNGIASGDDIFMLEKATKTGLDHVHYLKSTRAMVTTTAEKSLKFLISQRIRWAAKTSKYSSYFSKITALSVFAMNAILVCLLLFWIMDIASLRTLGYLFTLKFCIDFLLIFKVSRFFEQEQYLSSYIPSSFLYPFFSVYVAVSSIFKGYKWKGRSYKK
ncbi:glycosyltransferase family 2 protein [Mangrovimonas xylaniphaga]|uniref:glycosyltransferase family 2 protein n=1 Tax=Mangrovimonas xylaniphaga TaxID=1645915 RepID=UPI0006B4D424|nr:glycosyltransferase [Mangrovimonas xylaniphaga]